MLRRGLINQIGNIVKSGVAGTWAELIGTVSEYFQIGDGGVRLKKSGTDTLQIRNSDDSADGNVTVKQLEVIATDTYKTTVSMGTGATENQAFVFPSSPGADGQALLTNGGGSMSWGSPGGGHGEMYITENTTAFTIDAADEWHLLNGLTEGTNEGFTFDAGGSASISAFADYSGTVFGTVQVTTATAHGITTSGIVSITGTTNYDGVYEATVIDTTNFYITATWVSDDATGTVNHGSCLSVDTNYGDVYLVIWSASMKAATASEVFDFELYINASGMTVTERRNDFDNNTDYQTVAGNGIITVSDGDVITFAVKNVGNSGNITLRHLNVTLNKV